MTWLPDAAAVGYRLPGDRRAVFRTVLETYVGNAGFREGLLGCHHVEGVCL